MFKWLRRALSPGRNIWGQISSKESFWNEVTAGLFLLENLKDSDLNWALPDVYIHSIKRMIYTGELKEFEIITNMYLVWCSIAHQVDQFDDSEIDQNWMIKFDSAAQHIFERIYPYLTIDDKVRFEQTIPLLHASANKTQVYTVPEQWILS